MMYQVCLQSESMGLTSHRNIEADQDEEVRSQISSIQKEISQQAGRSFFATSIWRWEQSPNNPQGVMVAKRIPLIL